MVNMSSDPITAEGVLDRLKQMDGWIAAGPERIHPAIVNQTARI